MNWTPSRIAQLRFLWADGRSANEIAAALGVTRNAVMGKVHRLGLAARPSPIKRKPPPEPGAFTMPDLTDAHCRFPIGGPKDPPRFFCGCQVAVPGASYCPDHMMLTHVAARREADKTHWAGAQVKVFA